MATSKYTAALQRVGAVYEESILLLSQYARSDDWQLVKEKVLRENLLKKGSSRWTENILRAVRRRFLIENGILPNGKQVSKFMLCDVPKSYKVQLLYQYVCNSDALVNRAVTGLVGPALRQYGTSKLTKQMYLDFMANEAKSHPELRSWSTIVYNTWHRKFFAFLRHSGIMEKAPSFEIKKPVIRVEPFTFFLLGFLQLGLAPVEVVEHPLWDLYFLRQPEVDHLLVEAQSRGWIYYSKAGDIAVLKPRYSSLEEWLENGLEH
jgi:hypothetical protein